MGTVITVFAMVVVVFAAPGFAQGNPGGEPECTVHVGYDRNTELPGFYCDDPTGTVCVPFSPTNQLPPADYQGDDFYIEEFTDAKVKAKWQACKQDTECANQVLGLVNALGGVPHEFRNTGIVSPVGKIDPHGDVNLADIRRPAFFGQVPYHEEIAKVDDNTYIVEFTVPREPYERLHLNEHTPLKLRGWFIEGGGIEDEKGEKTHAVAIMIGGRSIETTAIQHPDDSLYVYDEATGKYNGIGYPSEQGNTEKWGLRQWRKYLYALHQAGFDVLTIDKRGHGISGGLSDIDAGEQAEDIFRMLDQLESGDGLRLLTPDGELLEANQAAGKLLRGLTAKSIPVVVGGPSQGSMVTVWTMHKNFTEFCPYHIPDAECRAPYGYNLKAGLMLADFAGGVGYTAPIFGLMEGYLRTEANILFLPTSETLANIDKWPAVFFGKGLWDGYQSVEGTFEAYKRATGLKEIVAVRGPHSENEFGKENVAYLIERMVSFAGRAVLNAETEGAGPGDLKEVVCSSPPYWEPSTAP